MSDLVDTENKSSIFTLTDTGEKILAVEVKGQYFMGTNPAGLDVVYTFLVAMDNETDQLYRHGKDSMLELRQHFIDLMLTAEVLFNIKHTSRMNLRAEIGFSKAYEVEPLVKSGFLKFKNAQVKFDYHIPYRDACGPITLKRLTC